MRQRKKALRDKSITQNFFNQGEPSTPSSSAKQSCSHATCRSHATNLPAPATSIASMYSLKKSLIETDHRTAAENVLAKVSALCNENYNNLTSEDREKVQAAIERLDPRSALETLSLAKDQIDVVLAPGGQLLLKETFDLADLDKVAKEYDKHCQKYKIKEEGQMATLAININNLASIASDTTRSTETRLAAGLDALNFIIDSEITVPLISCLRQVQLFNMEKRFGFVEESYEALRIEDERKPGEDIPTKMPLSFHQKNHPFKLTEPASGPREKKGEKKFSGLEALAQLQNNLKLASEEIQDLKATNDTQDFAEVVCAYADVPIPQAIPDHVRQRFLDADFALEQLAAIMEEASEQLLKVRSDLLAWRRAGHETWYVHLDAIAPIELVDRNPTQSLSW